MRHATKALMFVFVSAQDDWASGIFHNHPTQNPRAMSLRIQLTFRLRGQTVLYCFHFLFQKLNDLEGVDG